MLPPNIGNVVQCKKTYCKRKLRVLLKIVKNNLLPLLFHKHKTVGVL